MDWFEKEERYKVAYGNGRVASNLWKYIPKKVEDGVMHAYSDSDGYWVWLFPNWTAYDGAEDCGMIHVYTIEDLKTDLRTVRRAEYSREG